MAKIVIKRNDTARVLSDQLLVDGLPLNLTGATVNFILRPAGGVAVERSASVTNAAEGRVQYQVIGADVGTAGEFEAEWEVTLSGGNQLSFPTKDYYKIKIVEDLA